MNQNTTSSLRNINVIQDTFSCCGFRNATEYAVPANCSVIKNTQTSCRQALIENVEGSLSTIGFAGLAIGMIEMIGLILSAVLFRRIAQKENVQSSLMNESWRINRNKIQYGYQNYQYV